MNREELEKEAESLKIKVDGRWSDQKLSEKIQTAKLSAKMSSSKNTESTEEASQVDKGDNSPQDGSPEPKPEVDEKPELVEVVNCHNGLWQLPDGTCIKAGAVGELTKEQMDTPQVQRAIETGFLKVK
ncbi:hypothetical protein VPGG_00033 [Vibrio phage VBM1]|uniref:hypothetical protein n=1 Tax=Vibrio phage VBM1 TaxID=754074 RepID=UPI0002C14958|nr:hypothetical protein VPGG_00033 [Vibrio phage VBM1]AGH07350.1 hypothetical protein VPGG_00033 [Vibrio phage VBM1]